MIVVWGSAYCCASENTSVVGYSRRLPVHTAANSADTCLPGSHESALVVGQQVLDTAPLTKGS